MAYGMQQLRKAGAAMKDFDRAYAARAAAGKEAGDRSIADYGTPLDSIMGGDRSRYMADNAGPGNWMGVDVATEIVDPWTGARSSVAGQDLGYRHTMNDIMQMGTNVGVRYGLPAAGLTFAGKGLYDLTAAFGNGGDYPSEGTLPL